MAVSQGQVLRAALDLTAAARGRIVGVSGRMDF